LEDPDELFSEEFYQRTAGVLKNFYLGSDGVWKEKYPANIFEGVDYSLRPPPSEEFLTRLESIRNRRRRRWMVRLLLLARCETCGRAPAALIVAWKSRKAPSGSGCTFPHWHNLCRECWQKAGSKPQAFEIGGGE